MIGAQLFAAAAYLSPIAIWSLLRVGRSGADEGRFAVDLPVIVAADLVSVVLLTRVFTLETATLLSRTAWLLVGMIGGWRWWRAGGRPRLTEQTVRRVGELAVVALGAVLVSVQLSRACMIWDREWHIPLVTALRGQRLPFMNVFLPPAVLAYHFSGDVQAAMFQTLSGGRLHSSLALSLAHDVMFGLLALDIVCFLRATIVRRTLLAALVLIGVVMTGPVTLLRDPVHKLGSGFGMVNLLTLSFRPHVPLAYLMVLGFLQIVIRALMTEERSAPASEPSAPPGNESFHDWRARLGRLALLTVGLTITDEASLGILGLGLGALWLAYPRVVAPSRSRGALALLGMLVTVALTILVLGGSIGRGAPHYAMSLVPPRAPGYASPPVPLHVLDGQILLFQDLLPVFGAVAALIGIAAAVRDRVTRAIAVLYSAMALAAIVAFTCFDFEGRSSESHRFLTAIFASGPLLAAVAIGWRARVTGAAGTAAGGLAAIVFYMSVALGVASTMEWAGSGMAFAQCPNAAGFGWGSDQFYNVDCRYETDAVLGEKTAATYVDGSAFDLWAGCHPVFMPGPPLAPGGQKIKIDGPWYGPDAVAQVWRTMSAPTSRADVVCLTAVPTHDPVCVHARALGPCRPRQAFVSCSLDRGAIAALARQNPAPKPVIIVRPPAPRK